MSGYKQNNAIFILAAFAMLLNTCGVSERQTVEVTRVVPQTVVVTQIVERLITATAEPPQPKDTTQTTQTEPAMPDLSPDLTSTPWILPEGFEADVYLPPMPPAGEGAVTFPYCPNPAGLEEFTGFPVETALELINNLHSGDLEKMRRATDPALWQSLQNGIPEIGEVTKDWLDGEIFPASESPYAEVLSAQCGAEVVRLSWSAIVCPGPCQPGGSESLKDDYFFLWRNGVALIWLIW